MKTPKTFFDFIWDLKNIDLVTKKKICDEYFKFYKQDLIKFVHKLSENERKNI